MIKNKIKSIIATGVVLVMSYSAFADGWGEVRHCGDNNNFTNYTAVAQTQCSSLWGPKRSSQSRCIFDVEASSNYFNVGGRLIAEQKTKFGPSGFSSTGGTYRKRCSRGCFSSAFMQSMASNDAQGDSIYETHSITSSSPNYDITNRTITLSNISGYQSINIIDFHLKFRIVIWEPTNPQDSILTNVKIKWEGWVIFENGIVTYQNFTNSEISLNQTSGLNTLNFNNFNKTITFPVGANVANYAVRIESHAEPLVETEANQEVLNTEILISKDLIVFKLFPNPAKEIISILFDDFSDNKDSKVEIFDLKGKLVLDKFVKTNSSNIVNFDLDVSFLTKGKYFINVISNNKNYVKILIKE